MLVYLENCFDCNISPISELCSFHLISWLSYALQWLNSCFDLCNSIAEKFPYLVQKKRKEGAEIRRVAQIDWNIIADDCNQQFFASGLKFTPLPVNCHNLCLQWWECNTPLYYNDLTVFFMGVGYAWRGLHLFGLSFWWEKQGGLYIWCFPVSC